MEIAKYSSDDFDIFLTNGKEIGCHQSFSALMAPYLHIFTRV